MSGRTILSVNMVGTNPVIPAQVKGRPICLDDYDAFMVMQADGKYSLMPAQNFFATYIPSRVLFQGAGHG